jgi:hypothetical protein
MRRVRHVTCLGITQVFLHTYIKIPYLMQDFMGKGRLGEYGKDGRIILNSMFQKQAASVSII